MPKNVDNELFYYSIQTKVLRHKSNLIESFKFVSELSSRNLWIRNWNKFLTSSPPIFDGDNYDLWTVRMESYLEALDLWETVEEDYEVLALPNNPTMAQLKYHKERKTRTTKYFHKNYDPQNIKTNMGPFEGRIRRRWKDSRHASAEFDEGIWIAENERVWDNQWLKRLLSIAKKVRLLGTQFVDSRIVEKIMVTVLERYEASTTTLTLFFETIKGCWL